jgi:hypothetical protein
VERMEAGESIFEKWTISCSVTELSLVEILARVVNRRANMVTVPQKDVDSATLPSLRRPEVDPGALSCVVSEFDPSWQHHVT